MKLLNIFSYVIIAISLISCTSQNPEEVVQIQDLCDGSDELVLVVKATPIRENFVLGAIWNENGDRFIHVNGKCQFWVWGDIDPFSGLWASGSYVKTGNLSDAQGLELLEMLRYKRWGEADKTWFSAGLQNTKIEYFSQTAEFAFSGRDNSKEGLFRRELTDGFSDALEFLFEIGTPVQQDELRLLIVPGADDRLYDELNPTYFVNWKYPKSVEEFAAQQSPYCYGDSILLTGDDAAHFKREREAWLEASKSSFGLFIALKDTTGKYAYYFLLRDVLPYEDEDGLVNFPGINAAEKKCFPEE